jgi:hypothetical protein
MNASAWLIPMSQKRDMGHPADLEQRGHESGTWGTRALSVAQRKLRAETNRDGSIR